MPDKKIHARPLDAFDLKIVATDVRSLKKFSKTKFSNSLMAR